jgi:D-amino-acid dehydrogenase
MVTMWSVGAAFAYIVGWAMVSGGPDMWRWMLASSAVPAAAILLLRIGTPESPRWLLSKGRVEEARAVVKQMLGPDADLSDMDADSAATTHRYSDMFRGAYRSRTLFICLFWACQLLPIYAISTYEPTILQSFGLAEGNAAYLGAVIIQIFYVLGSLSGALFINRGRRSLLLWSFLISALPLLALSLLAQPPVALVVLLFAVFGVASFASQCLQAIYPSELFPTGIRATANGFATGVSRVGAALGTFGAPLLLAYSTRLAMFVAAVVALLGWLSSYFLAPETRHDPGRVELAHRDRAATRPSRSRRDVQRHHPDRRGVPMRPTETTSVAVLGAGLIGLCCAHYLAEAGLRVTVLERDRVGSGASRGNAGEVCPALVEPLPAPGVISAALRTAHRPESALYVHPSVSRDLARFLLGLARHATRARHAAGARELAALADGTFTLFERLEAAGVDAEARKSGYLFVHGSPESAHAARDRFARLNAPLAADGVLDAAALAELEPCLGPAARAGFVVDGQWSIDPSLFVDRLVDLLRRRGVEIVEGSRVTGVQSRTGGVRVHTVEGPVDADATVLAAGVWSREVARGLGVDLNIVPGKGYSLALRLDRTPTRLVHLGDAHVVVTPLAKGVRLAGTMEIDPNPDRFNPRRIAGIVAAARPYLDGGHWDELGNEWVGARPMTPDGLPAIGPLPGHRRVYLASGHNMLGLMLGPATGRLIADLVTEQARPEAWAAFAPGRLARPHRP